MDPRSVKTKTPVGDHLVFDEDFDSIEELMRRHAIQYDVRCDTFAMLRLRRSLAHAVIDRVIPSHCAISRVDMQSVAIDGADLFQGVAEWAEPGFNARGRIRRSIFAVKLFAIEMLCVRIA